ncbi:hypothetical protein BAUCODRAFT_144879 [Baudoinia panamericana UAMH 10762]|uniref:Peptidase A1 domain-containing protein n=1 Tax=Baudoinia panamericana (strain UAMH 10762) TaxID=717646 RepID=M2NK01_BAUPA|nr:uncharacterized protein BAUCODRAFT_144879 [Baudoinia panamericana UAMH 10762]EMC99460.1 hypothetical protein BAUCODRAFT_144879 [Baudoinia panamericana UAMH 10762]
MAHEAQRTIPDFPGVSESFNLVELPTRDVKLPLSPLQVTDKTINLKRTTSWTPSSIYAEALRRQAGVVRATVRDILRRVRALAKLSQNGSINLTPVTAGSSFLAQVTVGGQSFEMVVDTGSSDPWLVAPDFVCGYGAQSDCGFGPPYEQSATYIGPLQDQNFNISYADGERLTGTMGFEIFTIGGITVDRQEFAIAEYAEWTGDGISSGLVGFAYSSLTSAYPGSDPDNDPGQMAFKYNTLFDNLVQTEGVPPVYSMAIADEGGVMAFGGLPDVPYSPGFASVPILPYGVNDSNGQYVYTYYTVPIDGYAYAASPNTQFNTYNLSDPPTNPRKINIVGDTEANGPYPAIVDSGSTLVMVADYVASGVADLFDPPGTFDEDNGLYVVECTATAPVFGVSIANKIFYANPADLVIAVEEGLCISGVQSNSGGLTILGDVWMKSVLCVFDIGAEMMRFAAREFYGLTLQTKRANT